MTLKDLWFIPKLPLDWDAFKHDRDPLLILSPWSVFILQAISYTLVSKELSWLVLSFESLFLLLSGWDGKHILYKYLLWEGSHFWSDFPIHPSVITPSYVLALFILHLCHFHSYALNTSVFPDRMRLSSWRPRSLSYSVLYPYP